uniref:non-specific serine/threonine protein kinase n=1 Tax=Mantoniella antarctica TaxID=81844 RepID=A0A7S0SLH3_9CHLO|mmetsp:Transcript_27740/g.69530  ORF Transcript_27740/g.69530 Transcript_27740/m.69530 type:complete len:356 (+) Transcript_27740:101-1168(+)
MGCSASSLWRIITDAGRQILPQEEVRVEGRRFSVARQLGEGGFSFVYLVKEIGGSEEMALKRVLLHEEEHARAVEREVAVMRQFSHPNLLPLYAAELDPPEQLAVRGGHPSHPRRASLVFPAYPEGTVLDRALHRPEAQAFTPLQLLSVARQMCVALEVMHAAPGGPVAHRDVKPGNVLLAASMEVEGGVLAVLMDFGSARPARVAVRTRREALMQQEAAAAECTAPFRAPELWDTPSQCDLDERVDVWSLGCTVYAACAGGRSPFEYSMAQAGGSLALAVMSGRYSWPEAAMTQYPAEVRDVVACALNKDWRERPTAAEMRVKIEAALEAVRRGLRPSEGQGVDAGEVVVSLGV